MDLDRVRAMKAEWDSMPLEEAKNALRNTAFVAKGFLAENLPALPDTDRAAVAWFACELLNSMLHMPVRKISDVLSDTATAYGLAAVDLLGWMENAGE